MSKRQWGFTAATQEGYPPYLNVTEQDDGSFMVSVRSNPTFDGREGNQASIVLSSNEFRSYLVDLNRDLVPEGGPLP